MEKKKYGEVVLSQDQDEKALDSLGRHTCHSAMPLAYPLILHRIKISLLRRGHMTESFGVSYMASDQQKNTQKT